MSLTTAIDREIGKVKEIALAAALKLGFKPAKRLIADVYFELNYCSDGLDSAAAARIRCLGALGDTLEVNMDASDWTRRTDKALAVLSRNLAKAAPRPSREVLQAARREEKAQNAKLMAGRRTHARDLRLTRLAFAKHAIEREKAILKSLS